MKMNDLFPSKYLKADDFPQPRNLTLLNVIVEEIGPEKEEKAIVYFKETEKGLLLNKVNYIDIGNHLREDDTDNWMGKKVQLYKAMTMFNGKQTLVPTKPENKAIMKGLSLLAMGAAGLGNSTIQDTVVAIREWYEGSVDVPVTPPKVPTPAHDEQVIIPFDAN